MIERKNEKVPDKRIKKERMKMFGKWMKEKNEKVSNTKMKEIMKNWLVNEWKKSRWVSWKKEWRSVW